MTARWEKRIMHELDVERKLLLSKERETKLNGVTFSIYSTTEVPRDSNNSNNANNNNDASLSIFSKLCGYMLGPPETPYENGVFQVSIEIPSNYPLVPPKMKFLTIPYHPNVSSQTGAICVDILKTEWSPMLTLRKALLSLQLLLQCPNPDDPQDHIVADQYLNSTHNWEATAKLWTKERALNVNYLETMPPLFEKSVYIEYQKKALEKYYSDNRSKNNGDDSSNSLHLGTSDNGREECIICEIQ